MWAAASAPLVMRKDGDSACAGDNALLRTFADQAVIAIRRAPVQRGQAARAAAEAANGAKSAFLATMSQDPPADDTVIGMSGLCSTPG